MNVFGVCCEPCSDAGLCCQETSCCVECHFSLEENVALSYVPKHLADQVRKQHAEIQKAGFPSAMVKAHAEWEMPIFKRYCPPEVIQQIDEDHHAYDAGELHLQPQPKVPEIPGVSVGAVSVGAVSVGPSQLQPPQTRQPRRSTMYPRRTASVRSVPARTSQAPRNFCGQGMHYGCEIRGGGVPWCGCLPGRKIVVRGANPYVRRNPADQGYSDCVLTCQGHSNPQGCVAVSCAQYKEGWLTAPTPQAQSGVHFDARGNMIRRPMAPVRRPIRGMPSRAHRAVVRRPRP